MLRVQFTVVDQRSHTIQLLYASSYFVQYCKQRYYFCATRLNVPILFRVSMEVQYHAYTLRLHITYYRLYYAIS